jgi:hypothetical protein
MFALLLEGRSRTEYGRLSAAGTPNGFCLPATVHEKKGEKHDWQWKTK